LAVRWGELHILACVGLSLVLVAAPDAPLPDKSRRDFSANCLENGCHAQKRATRWVHAPVARGACETCHVEDAAPQQHRYRPARPMAELCTSCHRPGEPKAVRHEPYAKHDCVKCHNPHGGEDKDFIPAPDQASLCAQCHDGKEHDGRVIAAGPGKVTFPHEPVQKGECGGCHAPHESDHAKLLIRDPKLELCTGCHRELIPAVQAVDGQAEGYQVPTPLPTGARFADVGLLARGEIPPPPPDSVFYYVTGPIRGNPFPEAAPADSVGGVVVQLVLVHKPLTSDCAGCHPAHGSDSKAMLRDEPRRLCDGCHGEKMAKRLASARSRHGQAYESEACGSCHAGHTSRFAHLLRVPSRGLCLRCHDRAIRVDLVRRIPDIGAQITGATAVHEPAERSCVACHRSHASPEPRLLAGSYADGNYADDSSNAYALCFSCHENVAIEDEFSTRTGFRNGERNLHYLHVHGEHGRTCRTCHATHGSADPKLISRSTLFGPSRWPLPIQYEKTETGGSCSAGCHRRLYYDRVTPVTVQSGERSDVPGSGAQRR
jgi:predicted CXXCH cytochrome family protein